MKRMTKKMVIWLVGLSLMTSGIGAFAQEGGQVEPEAIIVEETTAPELIPSSTQYVATMEWDKPEATPALETEQATEAPSPSPQAEQATETPASPPEAEQTTEPPTSVPEIEQPADTALPNETDVPNDDPTVQPEPSRFVLVECIMDGVMAEGDDFILKATLVGFEGLSVDVQWQYYDVEEESWADGPGNSKDLVYKVTVNETNLGLQWRVLVSVTE